MTIRLILVRTKIINNCQKKPKTSTSCSFSASSTRGTSIKRQCIRMDITKSVSVAVFPNVSDQTKASDQNHRQFVFVAIHRDETKNRETKFR